MKKIILGLFVCVFVLSGCTASNEVVEQSTSSASGTAGFMKAKAAYLAYDFPVAFPLMLKEAGAGNMQAQYAVGYMYFYGQGIGVDYEESLKWIRKAAEQGYAKAFKALAVVNSKRKQSEREEHSQSESNN